MGATMITASHSKVGIAPLVLLLCSFSTALVIGVWLSTSRQIDEAHARVLSDAEHDAASFVRVIEEHTVRTIQSADQAVQFLKYEYLEEAGRLDIGRLVASGVILGDIFNLYTIVGPNGDVLLSSQPFTPVNLADREHIAVHRARADAGLFVSKPVLGRVSGKWSIQLTRRIDRPDGGFGGVAVVSMDPYYFTRLYESASIGEHSVVTLIGDDGIVRARRTGGASGIGQDLSNSELLRATQGRARGIARMRSPIDGRERVFAFHRLDNYPLIAVVGIDVADTMASFSRLRGQLVAQATLSIAAIALFTGVLLCLVRRLVRSRAQAIRANAAKTQFLSNMSHELRTPLNGILGYAELLSYELEDAAQREFARIIHDSGSHLLSLVNQLLQLNRIEAGMDGANLRTEVIRPLFEQAVAAHRGSAQAKSLALELHVDPSVPARIMCDRTKLLQVLHNLLHNAVKFTDRGNVTLDLAVDSGRLLIRVTDTGRGIPEGMLDKVFDKFFQVDSSDARISEGSGLGLALVRELVGMMDGEVEATSSRAEGTTFRITLPCLVPEDGPAGLPHIMEAP